VITDVLANIATYRRLSVNLDRAIEFIEQTNLVSLAPGRHVVAGDDVYLTVTHTELVDARSLQYEAHRRYIDIQLVIRGRERIYWAPLAAHDPAENAGLDVAGAAPGARLYNVEKDVLFVDLDGGAAIDLGPGGFCIFFPQDAHKPRCLTGENADVDRVDKIVFKVRTGGDEA
jgi:biofilm protein TabA